MTYKLMPGTVFVPYRDRQNYQSAVLETAQKVVVGRGFDERLIGWIIKVF